MIEKRMIKLTEEQLAIMKNWPEAPDLSGPLEVMRTSINGDCLHVYETDVGLRSYFFSPRQYELIDIAKTIPRKLDAVPDIPKADPLNLQSTFGENIAEITVRFK